MIESDETKWVFLPGKVEICVLSDNINQVTRTQNTKKNLKPK